MTQKHRVQSFAATSELIRQGVDAGSAAQAAERIAGWEALLRKVDPPGARSIVDDLVRLQAAMRADALDHDAMRELVARLGRETVALGERFAGAKAGKIEAFGRALRRASAEMRASAEHGGT